MGDGGQHTYSATASSHQQQELANLLATAIPGGGGGGSSDGGGAIAVDEATRVAAIVSVHRMILQPYAALHLRRSSLRISHSLHRLLFDKSCAVRQAAVVAYGAWGAVAAAVTTPSSVRGNSVLPGGPAEQFIGWALPQLGQASVDNDAAVLSLTGLKEFLSVGGPGALERFAPPILRACQSLLEDDGTSMTLLRPLLGVLVVLGRRFSWCVQPHFADMVDLLLGWALESEVSEVDCRIITDSFVQFQDLWVGSLSFSMNLLSKFLGDMEVLAHDANPTTPQQLRRLLALAFCFVAVLQALTSGILESDKVELITVPALEMLPRLITCLATVSRKFRDFSWTVVACQCMTLFADFLKEKFASHYPSVLQALFQNMESGPRASQQNDVIGLVTVSAGVALQAQQVHTLLQVNLQLLSAQGHTLEVSAVHKLLKWNSLVSSLRLHPSRLVTSIVATTYLFLLQHCSETVASEANKCLKEELIGLKLFLAQRPTEDCEHVKRISSRRISDAEAIALFKFDLTALVGRVCLKTAVTVKPHAEKGPLLLADQQLNRALELKRFVLDKLLPCKDPLQGYPSLQLSIVQALHRLCSVMLSLKVSAAPPTEMDLGLVGMNFLNECSEVIVPSLEPFASLPLILGVLNWISSLCEAVSSQKEQARSLEANGTRSLQTSPDNTVETSGLSFSFLSTLLSAAAHREPTVRGRVAFVLEQLLQAGMVAPAQLQSVAVVALDQLGDPDPHLQVVFRKVLSAFAPAALWICGWISGDSNADSPPSWKQLYQRKHSIGHLRPQQLVTILNYISQRWQSLPQNWLQRLVHNCPVKSVPSEEEERLAKLESSTGDLKADHRADDLAFDADLLEKACGSNNLAAAWWAIQIGAQHLVTVRLRTHLGGPTQTFAVLERMLVDAALMFETDSGQRESASTVSSTAVQLLPMRLLLEFMESLEKNIYNAYEGSVVLPDAPPASAPFFRANRKVCEEWFVRIRDALLNLSAAIQCHSGTFHHASLRLQDLSVATASALRESTRPQLSDAQPSLKLKLQQDAYRVLRYSSLALCRAHKVDVLPGLQAWAMANFGAVLGEDSNISQKVVGPLSWMTGLGFQAEGQYERAVAHYSHLLQSEEALGAMGADGVQFTIARMIESYVALSDWEALDSWLQDLQLLRAKHAGKSYSGALTTAGNDMNAIHALARFDACDVSGAWGYLDLTPQSSNELTADPRQALPRSEQMLLQAMLRPRSTEESTQDVATAKAMLEAGLQVASLDSLPDAAPLIIQLECIRAFEAGFSSRHGGLDDPTRLKLPDLFSSSALPQVTKSPLDALQQDCHLWLKLFRVYHTVLPDSPVTLQLHEQLIRLARKQFNFKLARRLLLQTPGERGFKYGMISGAVLPRSFKYESILLSYAEENYVDATVELWEFSRGFILNTPSQSIELDNILSAKACLKLSSWLQHRPSSVSLANLVPRLSLDKNCDRSSEITVDEDLVARNTDRFPHGKSSAILQEIVGAGMKAATVLCPEMAKAWFLYASWCYDRARSFLLGSSTPKPQILSQPLELQLDGSGESVRSEMILAIVSDAISQTFSKIEEEENAGGGSRPMHDSKVSMEGVTLNSLVQRLVFVMENAAGMMGVEDSDGESPGMLVSMQLHQELQILSVIDSAIDVTTLINQLMHVWWDVRRKKVSLFGHAARGFLHYLSMSNNEHPNPQSNGKFWPDRVKSKRADGVLSATLFVLRILLNYGVELEDVLVQGLASVPPSPWQALTAQLFARLSSHPEVKVRKQLEGLLMSLAHVSPWAIVYPTLVDINACEGQPSEELHRILSCLVYLHPRLVKDVQVMIAELGAITVLWEEQWLSTLQDLHADVMRRISTLKDEAARVAENPTLSHAEKVRINAAKYSAMMAPVAVALERRLASTSRPAVTPHEVWFQEQFGTQLKTAISNFKAPSAGLTSLGDAWVSLDAIAASFNSHQKKSSTLLSDISPQLAAVRSSEAPMPGLEVQTSGLQGVVQDLSKDVRITKENNGYAGMVTIAAFDEQVAILATKTKPKKISMVGSDGERYTYLLKGREDLRLDSRIMQLLHAVNGMLRAHGTTRRRGLAVRHYSVTPISGRAGLIQWLNNLTSMYSVYKGWQQRVQAVQRSASGAVDTMHPPEVPRPSDLFYGKIIPALKEKGLRKVISRRDWPQEVKRKVLLELMKETPRQLLHRELWCASAGLHNFNLKQERFSGSVAVMSMVGYILGLGDRHLDNILVDFSTGDVVHIDYNVCFDKGLRLKIPEIVPFRLTQTIQAALGLTGVEGMFRANCEAVLKALQNHKDLILMLLEVFIWDPLVEWMRGDGHDEATIGGEERKGMELAVSLSLFASRVQEIRVPLQKHHDQLLTTLPTVSQALQRWTEAGDRYERALAASGQLEQKRLMILRTEAAARALMAESSTALEQARIGHEMQVHDFGQVKGQLAEAAVEMTQWVEQHMRVLNALRNGNVPEVQAIGKLPSLLEGLSLTAAVLSAGVPLTIVPEPAQIHCKEVDREVAQLIATRHEALIHASQMLQAYSMALQRLLPGNYMASCDGHSWAQILQALVRKLSPEVLAAARHQASDLVARGRGEHDEIVRQKYEALQVHVEQLWKEVRKIQAECTELEESIDVEAERKAKDRLLTVFSRHLLSRGKSKKEDDLLSTVVNLSKSEEGKERDSGGVPLETEDKRAKVLSVLHSAVATLVGEISERIGARTSDGGVFPYGNENGPEVWRWCLPEFQKHVEQWALVSDLITEFHQVGSPLSDGLLQIAEWAQSCRACIAGVEDLGSQLGGLVLPEALKASLSHDPVVLEAFTSLSQVRLSVDDAIEQVAVIEAQRSSLLGLEKSYPEKVDQISKRQAELEDNAARSREHLSWEEADELASEEEACRAVLEELHRAWAQRGYQASAISRSEMNVKAALGAAEQQFDALVALDPDGDLHLMRGKVLLAAFARLFAGLEPLDHLLTSFARESGELEGELGTQTEFLNAGYPGLKSVRKSSNMNYNKMFFVWKVRVMDTLLNLCVQDASSNEDVTTGLDQILSHQKKRLEIQLQNFLDQYLRERVGPVILHCLSRQKQLLRPAVTEGDDFVQQQIKKEEEPAVKRALRLIYEYCDAHETVRSTNSAVSSLKSRVDDLMQALHKAHMDAAQLEWLHDGALARTISQNQLLGLPSSFSGEPNGTNVAWWSRQKVLEGLQSSVSAINRATEALQACEEASLSAEEQLDRAMAWACAGPSNSSIALSNTTSSSRNIGIPTEFHEHLRRRRQILWSGHEQSTAIARLCAAVLEFEASRGVWNQAFQKDMSQQLSTSCVTDCRHPWQKPYLNLISRLEAAYHSFTSSDREWQEAQKKSEAVAAHLGNITEELRIASQDVESAARELQAANMELREMTFAASTAVSSFCRVMRDHSALTAESGTMIEEVLAISDGAEGAHDVHSLAQEAFAEHKQLMIDLGKVNHLILPLDPMLVSAATTFTHRVSDGGDREVDMEVGSQAHSSVALQSLLKNIREVAPVVAHIIPGLITYVKCLHSSLAKLARTASLDAGVLHKALEGVGESQESRSQEIAGVGSDLGAVRVASSEGQTNGFVELNIRDGATRLASQSDGLYLQDDEETFLSPPDSSVSLESVNANEHSRFQLTVEASPRLTGCSGASPSTTRKKNTLNGTSSNQPLELGGASNALAVEEGADTPVNGLAPTASEDYRHSGTVASSLGKEDKDMDNHSCLKRTKANFETLKISDASPSTQTAVNSTSGSHRDQQIQMVPNHSKQELSRAKGNYHVMNPDFQQRNTREKNAYAVSVLKRVRTKLEGQDINGSRQLAVAEHVDHLLRQATSVDNLCNMFEGWTPWI
ncbi:unnamed protein product [Calypogeia fissa]